MTIQNIEDVMERIMSLNRNLTEESLKTLLSASGWDREDIMEGLRIFRSKNKNTVSAAPITFEVNKNPNSPTPKVEDKKEINNTQNVYSFNLKNKNPESSKVETEDIVSPNLIKQNMEDKITTPNPPEYLATVEKMKEETKDKPLPSNDFFGKVVPANETRVNIIPTATPSIEPKKKHSGFSKLFFYILLLFILILLAGYLLFPELTNFINGKLSFLSNHKSMMVSENLPQQNINSNPNTVTTPTTPVEQSPDIEELRREIADLKNELNNYKNNSSEEKTVIKYISQRGPAGPAGRGVVSIGATTTGFIINYSDGSGDIIPYSTTTIMNILRAQNICFVDASSTIMASSSDICLDRNSVLALINK